MSFECNEANLKDNKNSNFGYQNEQTFEANRSN